MYIGEKADAKQHGQSDSGYGPTCRYSVRMPETSWYTAYDVCEQNNQILTEITSLSEMYIMEDLLSDVDSLFFNPINVSVGLWIGGFMRTSNKEILMRDCKSMNSLSAIHKPEEKFTEEIVCLYYNRTAMKIYTDNCKKTKPFICERKEEDCYWVPTRIYRVSQSHRQ
ncbi:uncharacterized protein LOC133202026 [Saccostrea echinata]|uniref:uncharacterized protein LOC133202026 n=1 Tax=Saccostrea echinata TaxID=191078 RepID=UPI002A7FB67A|nr:uncharacterized protein LOC133202026 [Saccostrea echinata]